MQTVVGRGLKYTASNTVPPPPPLVLAKPVKHIQTLEFVEMRDPFRQYGSGRKTRGSSPQPDPIGGRAKGGWGATDMGHLLFFTYVAVIYKAHPERVDNMLAYARLIREAHRHGGNGWLTNDAVFWCGGLQTVECARPLPKHSVYSRTRHTPTSLMKTLQ